MNRRLGLAALIIGLLAASAVAYLIEFLAFGDARDIWFYTILDFAFLPIQVILVAIVIEGLLARHERRQLLRKMNMVIGTFFSELGTRLLGDLTPTLANRGDVMEALAVRADWKPADFRRAETRAAALDYRVNLVGFDLEALKRDLLGQRNLLVLLLANPNLLEHERFTDLLWAVFHLMEELEARPLLDNLPDADREHLAGDVRRVCTPLAVEWIHYCRHLQHAYPYIFSIVLRTHPFQEHPSATVR